MILDKNGQSAVDGALHGNISLGDSETAEGGAGFYTCSRFFLRLSAHRLVSLAVM